MLRHQQSAIQDILRETGKIKIAEPRLAKTPSGEYKTFSDMFSHKSPL